MAGAGGSAGEVSYPTYMEDVQKDWLGYAGSPTAISTDMIAVMDAALLTNPLDTLSYTDPATDISEIDSQFTSFETKVNALDPTTDWQGLVDSAVSKVDAAGVLNDIDIATLISNAQTEAQNDLQKAVEKALVMIDDVLVEKAIKQFIRVREKERNRMRTKFKANMSSIGAERSSAYALGLALLEMDFEREAGQFQQEFSNQLYQEGVQFYARALATEIQVRMQARSQNKQTRDQMIVNGSFRMLEYKQFIVQMKNQLASLIAEVKRIGFLLDSEYIERTADLNWKHSSWDMNVYKNGINVLGGIGGSQFVPEGPSKGQSALGGALSGAAVGAQAGAGLATASGAAAGTTALPGIGTAAGALLGLGAGLFG